MTISKFLMTVAVCAVSISGITTSHGSSALSADDVHTPARQQFGSPTDSNCNSAVRSQHDHEDAASSTGSIRSTTSTISQLTQSIEEIASMLAEIPKEVTFPPQLEGTTPQRLSNSKTGRIKHALRNLINAYTRLVVDYNSKTNKLNAAQDTITKLRGQMQQPENNAANPVDATPAVGDSQTPENNQSSPVETPSDVNNSSQWIAVAVGFVLGAGIVPLGNFIVEGYLSIAASFWGR